METDVRSAGESVVGALRGLAAGCVIVAIALALEVVAVAILHHEQLTGPWELRAALVGILPVAVVLSVPLVALFTTLAELVLGGALRGRILVTTTASLGTGLFAYGVTFGRNFQQPFVRLGAVSAAIVVVGAVTWSLLPSLARAWRSFPRGCALVFGATALVLEVANALVLPRLYPAFHLTLSVLAVALVAWACRPLAGELSRRTWIKAAGSVVMLAVVVSPYSLHVLSSWDNVRVLYLSKAPTLSHAVRAAAACRTVDSEGLELAIDDELETAWLDWRDRDLLLITVDALRADRVGAYGYGRNTTPHIDELAARGVVFEHAYTVMPHTSYAIASLLTGKYIRPLLVQGTGHDSDTLAGLLRSYGYRTAAFYPPSLFAVDDEYFAWAKTSGFDFEYRKLEYADASLRRDQVIRYLDDVAGDHRVFLWTHFFEPHEPYAPPARFNFGSRATDRYDGEIATVDEAVGQLVGEVMKRRPNTVVIITADHGEAFGEHGSYYHGTTVYEEQVHVPLVVVAPDLAPAHVSVPVQLIDIMPTILRTMGVPRRPRIRGVDLSGWMTGRGEGEGFAFSETHEHAMLAEASWRFVCERKIDACLLFDVAVDPQQLHDVSVREPDRVSKMRQRLRGLDASHGTYEKAGSRAEGKDLPASLVQAMAGDIAAAEDVAGLLEDADVVIRRKAGETLFQLAHKPTAPSLSLALSRDDDLEVRRWCAVALTRMGHGAPLALDLVDDGDLAWKRRAALALAESGDGRGEAILVGWWDSDDPSVERRKEIAKALANVRAKSAVVPLIKQLDSVALRPILATSLAAIGEPYARIPLLRYFAEERYAHTRLVLARALVALGASREMAPSLVRFLGVPDPLDGGVGVGLDARIMTSLGGPSDKDLERLAKAGREGADVRIMLPRGGNGTGYRVIVRAKGAEDVASVRIGRVASGVGPPRLDATAFLSLSVPPGVTSEVHATLGSTFGALRAGPLHVMVIPDLGVRVEGFVVVPLDDDIPPPAPEPWDPDAQP